MPSASCRIAGGTNAALQGYLFGSLSSVSDTDLVVIVLLSLAVMGTMAVFAREGKGLYVAPDLGESQLVRAGRMKPLRQRFYMLTVQRRIGHPTVARLAGAARERLFAK